MGSVWIQFEIGLDSVWVQFQFECGLGSMIMLKVSRHFLCSCFGRSLKIGFGFIWIRFGFGFISVWIRFGFSFNSAWVHFGFDFDSVYAHSF